MTHVSERKVGEYSLHVRADGEEVNFRELPWDPLTRYPRPLLRSGSAALPVHVVTVFEQADSSLIEQIEVRSIKVNMGETFIYPRPHGVGWTKWDPDDRDPENYTLYRRPKSSGERRTFNSLREYLEACQ